MPYRELTLSSNQTQQVEIDTRDAIAVELTTDPGNRRGVGSADPPVQSYEITIEKFEDGSYTELSQSPVSSSSLDVSLWSVVDVGIRLRFSVNNTSSSTGTISLNMKLFDEDDDPVPLMRNVSVGGPVTSSIQEDPVLIGTNAQNDGEETNVVVGQDAIARAGSLTPPGGSVVMGDAAEGSTQQSDSNTGHNVIIGYQASSQYNANVTIGTNSFSAFNSVIIGAGATSTAFSTVVIGSNATSNFWGRTVCVGRQTEVTQEDSVAVGDSAVAGDESIAIGADSDADRGISLTSLGYFAGQGTTNDIGESIMIGHFASSEAQGAIVIGKSADASGSQAISIGHSTVVDTANLARIGANQMVVGGVQNTVADADMNNSEITWGINETPSTNVIQPRYKDSGGSIGHSMNVPSGDAYHVAGTQVVGSQEPAIASLTNDTGGTTDGTLAAVSGSGADATINNNLSELNDKINEIRTALQNHGLIAT